MTRSEVASARVSLRGAVYYYFRAMLFSSIASSTAILNFPLNLQIYFAQMNSPKGDTFFVYVSFLMVTTVCLVSTALDIRLAH